MSLPPSLRNRVLAEAAATPSPTRREHRARRAVVTGLGLATTAALFLATGRYLRGHRPIELVVFSVATSLAGAAMLTYVTARGRSMLGRPRSVLFAASSLVAVALALFVFVGAVAFPAPLSPEDVRPLTHLACAALTVLQGAPLLVTLLVVRRGTDPVFPAVSGAALGMTAAAWAATMAYVRCPHAAAVHCTLAHVLPSLLFVAAGAVVGRALLKIR